MTGVKILVTADKDRAQRLFRAKLLTSGGELTMQDKPTDLQRDTKDSGVKGAAETADSLINRVADEMMISESKAKQDNTAAPDSAVARYGLVTAKGIGHVPEGIVNAVVYDVKHPMETLGTLGMGAGMAVVLKTVLPEGGMAGKVAGLAIGGYFTYKAAEPIMHAYKEAGNAKTMGELNTAAMQIGDAGGAFLVNSAIAAGGYKIGASATEAALASKSMAGFVTAKANFYENVGQMGSRFANTIGITKPVPQFTPESYGVIPPYLLEELARRNPGNPDFLKTYQHTLDGQSKHAAFRPRAGQDYHGAREVYDAEGSESLPGKKARFEGEKPTSSAEVNNAYDYTGFIRDFYQKEYGRNSIDAKGMKLVSTVNYGENYENAFWNGSQMTYGRPGPNSPFKTFMLLDVAGHEITHGVTEMESGLRYRGQSGALNESLSDVYGELIKQYSKGQSSAKADWLVGDGIWKETVKGRALRDMRNPGTAYDDPQLGKDPQPAHMKDYYKTSGDNGGVHYNSGIPNKAFAQFAIDVGGNAWDTPGKIWFAARKAAGSNPSFSQFAYHTIEQAKALGHSDLIPKLQGSWDAVGVKPSATALDTTTPSGGGWGDGDNAAAKKPPVKKAG